MNKEPRILIVAGEASGDLYAGHLVEQIRRKAGVNITFLGCAGHEMRRAGVEPIVRVEEVSVHGFLEVLSHLAILRKAFHQLVAAANQLKPDLAILVDFPDFNMRLARRLKKLGVKIVYFISPQFWAWRKGRINVLKGLIEEMICILPFEEASYRQAGVPAEFVGHPLVELLDREDSEEHPADAGWFAGSGPKVAILPGSRKNEIRHNLPVLLDSIVRIQERRPEVQFALAVSANVGVNYVQKRLDQWRMSASKPPRMILEEGQTRSLLKRCDAAVVSSGTATLEAALLGCPFICVYRVAPLSWWVGQKLVDVPYYCLVNLVLNRPVVKELFQRDFSPAVVEREVYRLLDDAPGSEAMRSEFTGLRRVLASRGSPLERSAEIVIRHLETN
ncbi:MAG: lipid-A-disaccharide synthase [Acidobacteriia bacterium]|nr:lipid-A-disaccharide synthase [Terriglobia bacterium]